MKRLVTIIFAVALLLGFGVNSAFAVEPYEDTSDDICASLSPDIPNYQTLCGGKGEPELMANVRSILNTVYFWVAIIAVIVIIIGGVKYMTSQGDAGKVKMAKDTIMYAIIGLVVVLLAFSITNFVLRSVGGGTAGGGGGGGSGGGGGGGLGGTAVTSLQVTSADKIAEGDTLQLKVKITPNYADNKTLTFSSSDPSVATISNSGMITALKSGTTTITATASNGVTTTKTVTVEKVVKVTSIKLEPSSATVAIGKSTTIKATVTPSDATDADLTWSSSDTSVATVTNAGVITGKKAGTATITVTAKNGVKTTLTVTVEPEVTRYSAVFEQRNFKASNGQTFDYIVNVPEGATSNMPLLIFLHGDGEVGRPGAVKNLKQVQYAHGNKKFIFLAPVTTVTDWTAEKIQVGLKALIDKYIADYKINTKKVYLMGFSRGAIGTWTMVNRYPDLFAATVPVSCCGNVTASKYKTTKVYALAGGSESNYIPCMKSNVNAINSAGGSAKFETVPGQSHSTITGAFPYTDVIDNWLLKQSR